MRQLTLFKGARQRGEEPPPPPEFLLCCALADLLRRSCLPEWRWTHLPFGELRNPKTGARLKRMGTGRGWPDYVFAGPQQRVAWLELKRPRKGRISDNQLEISQHLEASGFAYLCTSDLKTAIEYLKRHGVVRATVQ